MAKLDEFDKEALKGVYGGKGESGNLNMSELQSNLRLAFVMNHPFGESLFPEEAEEAARLDGRRPSERFIPVDEIPSHTVQETLRLRAKLEAAATEFLRRHRHIVSTDAKPGSVDGHKFRRHFKDKPVLKHPISSYRLADLVYTGYMGRDIKIA